MTVLTRFATAQTRPVLAATAPLVPLLGTCWSLSRRSYRTDRNISISCHRHQSSQRDETNSSAAASQPNSSNTSHQPFAIRSPSSWSAGPASPAPAGASATGTPRPTRTVNGPNRARPASHAAHVSQTKAPPSAHASAATSVHPLATHPPPFSPDFIPGTSPSPVTWETISEHKRGVRDARIPASWKMYNSLLPLNVTGVPETCGILSPEDITITATPAPRLVQLMLERVYTSEQVTAAFCKRAAVAQQLTNCLTEIFFARALSDARALDAQYKSTGVSAGRLHGLPVSLKDNFNLPGVDSSNGFIAYCNRPMGEDDTADIAKIMRGAGAILYCKTNVPTAMLMGESYNNVWGCTTNPYNTDYTPGGSSGGEAALIALGGSPLGVGTDIGGSIRMPAGMCGLYGLKPSAGRFPVIGIRPVLPGQESVRPTVGPIAGDLDSIELWSKVVLESKPWERDPSVVHMPWRDDVHVSDKLCFGIIMDDGMVQPTPAVTRVLRETKAALEAAGHSVVEWSPPDTREGVALLKQFLLGDGGVRIGRVLKEGSTPEPWPLQLGTVEKHYKRLRAGAPPPTVSAMWDLQAAKQRYLRRMLDAWMATKDLSDHGRPFDAVISPVCAFPSTPRYSFRHAGYSGIWNIADMTSMAFPAGKARKSDIKTGEVAWRNDDEWKIWAKYDADRLDGMPVGLQLVTPRHTEELSVQLTRLVMEAIQEQEKTKE